jgi:hypothetical protein
MKPSIIGNIARPRKNQFLNWSRDHESSIQRAAAVAKSTVVLGPNGYEIIANSAQDDGVEGFLVRRHETLATIENVSINEKPPKRILKIYNPLRTKTKGDSRARYEFLYSQIIEKLEGFEVRNEDAISSANSYSKIFEKLEELKVVEAQSLYYLGSYLSSGEVERPKKYVPSEELVTIVRNSNVRRQGELEILSKDNKIALDEDAVALNFMYEGELTNHSSEKIRTYIYNSVRGFLATIGQGLAYGDGESAVLGKDGELLEVVLAGFRHRIPVMLKDAGVFSAQLYKDLEKAARYDLLNSEFGKLTMQDNVLSVKRIKSVIPASERAGKRERAEIARLG